MRQTASGKPIDDLVQPQLLFDEDDYTEIFQSHFAKVVRNRASSALPAGWHNPFSVAAEQVTPTSVQGLQVQQYALDEAYSLEDDKTDILRLVEAWENRSIAYLELTLLPSVSSANLTTMAALAGLGFRRVVFKTPTYYASLSCEIAFNDAPF